MELQINPINPVQVIALLLVGFVIGFFGGVFLTTGVAAFRDLWAKKQHRKDQLAFAKEPLVSLQKVLGDLKRTEQDPHA